MNEKFYSNNNITQQRRNMKYLIFKVFVVFVFFYILLYSHVCLAYTENPLDCDHTDTRFNCVKYVSNYDGDTITIDIPNIHPF